MLSISYVPTVSPPEATLTFQLDSKGSELTVCIAI